MRIWVEVSFGIVPTGRWYRNYAKERSVRFRCRIYRVLRLKIYRKSNQLEMYDLVALGLIPTSFRWNIENLVLADPKPNIFELERRISAIFVNSYAPLATSRPTVPGFIEVGGLHIKEPRPLPADIKEYLDGASHGAILFSLGILKRQCSLRNRFFNNNSLFRFEFEDFGNANPTITRFHSYFQRIQ